MKAVVATLGKRALIQTVGSEICVKLVYVSRRARGLTLEILQSAKRIAPATLLPKTGLIPAMVISRPRITQALRSPSSKTGSLSLIPKISAWHGIDRNILRAITNVDLVWSLCAQGIAIASFMTDAQSSTERKLHGSAALRGCARK